MGQGGRQPTQAGLPKFSQDMSQTVSAASTLLRTLANENRLMILCLLMDGEKSVRELETALELRQPTISQHLAKLRARQLVTARREGKAVYYDMVDDGLRQILEAIHQVYCPK